MFLVINVRGRQPREREGVLALQQICRTSNATAQPAHNVEICVKYKLEIIETFSSCVHEHDGGRQYGTT